MIKKRSHRSKRKFGRGGNKKRVPVTAIYNAIRKYPRSSGASVRDIHRFVTKNGQNRKSISSIKLAIARAVRRGNIRAPKGWQGFRGICYRARGGNIKRQQSTRRGRRPSTRRGGARMAKSANRKRSGFRRKSAGRGRSKSAGRGRSSLRRKNLGRGRSASRKHFGRGRKSLGRGRSASRKHFGRSRGRGFSRGRYDRRVRFRRRPSVNSSNDANMSANYNIGEAVEGETTSLWDAYPCIIS